MSLQLIKLSAWWLPARFKTMHDKTLQSVIIPAGFETDGASVPVWLPFFGLGFLCLGYWHWLFFLPAFLLILALALFPRFGKTFDAALLHDYCLQTNPYQWRRANKLFLRQLKEDGIHRWRAYTMYIAVSIYQFLKWGFNYVSKR